MNVALLWPSIQVLILLSDSILSSGVGEADRKPARSPFHSPPRTAFNMLLLPAGRRPHRWPCQHWPWRIRNSTIKGQNCSSYSGTGGGECGTAQGRPQWGQGVLGPEKQFEVSEPKATATGTDEWETLRKNRS